jgi:hypothetical protein
VRGKDTELGVNYNSQVFATKPKRASQAQGFGIIHKVFLYVRKITNLHPPQVDIGGAYQTLMK